MPRRLQITLLIFLLAAFVRVLPGQRTVDDAYITFRYAQNIVQGAGFVYNTGERVMGTTTPLYAGLLVLSSIVLQHNHYPFIALWLNAFADAITCALLISLGHTLSGNRTVGQATALLYAVAPFSVTFAIGGMETSVVVLCLTLTALLYLRRNALWGIAAALATLTRPDALIFVAPLFAVLALNLFVSRNSSAFRPAVYFAAVLAPWLAFATYYFGSPLPHSIAAKGVAYRVGATDALVRFWQHYSTPFYEQATFESLPYGNYFPLAGIILYLSLYLIGMLAFARRNRHSLAVTIYPLFYFAVFAIANPLIFRWYLTPPMPLYMLGILGALMPLVPQRLPGMRLLPAAILLALSLNGWTLQPDHGSNRPAPKMAWFKLEQLYTQVGSDLAAQVSPDKVVAAGDIGAVGYYSGARILDTLGLVSPESSAYYPLPDEQLVITYAIASDLIADHQPDYVVFLEVYGRRTLLMDARFLANYALWKRIDTDIYGSDGLLVYRRGK